VQERDDAEHRCQDGARAVDTYPADAFPDEAFPDEAFPDEAFPDEAFPDGTPPAYPQPVDWAGHVPQPLPRAPGTDRLPAPRAPLAVELDTALARMVLARARGRAESALDVVRFTAACPACGADCEWRQERQDTRVRSTMDCPCVGPGGATGPAGRAAEGAPVTAG